MISMGTKKMVKQQYHFPTHETYQMSKALSNSESQNPELATLEGKQKTSQMSELLQGERIFFTMTNAKRAALSSLSDTQKTRQKHIMAHPIDDMIPHHHMIPRCHFEPMQWEPHA